MKQILKSKIMIRLKDYYSWSQHSTWLSSKKQYYKRYSLGETSFQNKYFAKGDELGNYLIQINENPGVDPATIAASMSTDPKLHAVGCKVPAYDIMEDELNVVMKDGSTLKGYVDSASIDNAKFLEYKSGKIPWTQEKVNEHGQLDFYALCYFIKSGRKVIPECHLVWIETEEVEIFNEIGDVSHTELRYTGNVGAFKREFTKAGLLKYERELIKAIKDIEKYEHIEMDLDEDLVAKYIELKQTVENCQKQMDAIKSEVLVEMQLENMKYATSSIGKFSISERKSWSYSDSLTASMDETKKLFDEQKKLEQKDGSANYSVSQSISFKEI